ncbi:MAG TPA: NAD(P)/FAD-dependent oxidoreductase, partial [Gemmatimonadales bacterium]|nr:NAD(P)/FAD-dependent oxidoreductase [Gemmatimonadales bacterium]
MPPSIAIIGAGAAGLMAAIHAASAGGRVVLLERTGDGGRKILISGGGRCNVLPASLDERRFVTASSPNSLRKILRSWPHREMRTFFERDANLPLVVEESTGKLFP